MENRSKWSKQTDKNLKAMGAGERTSKKVSTIRKSDGTSFRRKNANQYGSAEGGNDYTEKRVNRTDRFDLGGTADSAENGGANIGGTLGSSMMKTGGGVNNIEINELLNGYFSAVLFAEMDSDTEEPLDGNYSMSDFDKETIDSTKKMLTTFYSKNKKAIKDSGLDLDTIGMDIWYARAGHGAGFFDHNLDSDVEQKLTKGAKALGEYPMVETYDGKISIRGGRVFKGNGGGLANVPESFPETDAISYGEGGSIKVGDKVMLPEIKMRDGKTQFEKVENGEVLSIENGIYDVLNPKTNRIHRVTLNQIKYKNGGSTKGFEYSIGGL